MKQMFIFNRYGWWLKIDTIEKLNAWMDYTWNIRKEKVKRSIENVKKGGYLTDPITNTAEVFQKMRGTSLEDELARLEQAQRITMRESIRKGEIIYVNSLGAYHTGKTRTVKRYDKEGFDFPCWSISDITIKQWPSGTHWYAYIGEIEVKNKNGNIKWDTKEEAENVAEKYIKR